MQLEPGFFVTNHANCMEHSKIEELPGLLVTVDEVLYMPDLDSPADRPHPFIYFITISNQSPLPVTVRGRKWVVQEQNGSVQVVEGDGVVGQFPYLLPGKDFSYNSKHFVATHSTVSGAFFVQSDDGKFYCTRVPSFALQLPDWV